MREKIPNRRTAEVIAEHGEDASLVVHASSFTSMSMRHYNPDRTHRLGTLAQAGIDGFLSAAPVEAFCFHRFHEDGLEVRNLNAMIEPGERHCRL